MNNAAQIRKIVDRIHPAYYPIQITPSNESDCLLVKKNLLLGRQAFAMVGLDEVDASQTVSAARSQVKELMSAMWVFREVGLYLVVHGSEELWRSGINSVRPDRTGIHSVIIQGIHFIDFASGAVSIKQSRWGACKFGDLVLPHSVTP